MSFCPTRDVHSVYIDNEMSQKYVAEYEAHIKTCPKCQHELQLLRNVHDALKQDADLSSPEKVFNRENYMDESYKRLMIKMAYNNNIKLSSNGINGSVVKKRLLESVRYSIPTAIAAVVLAIILPVRTLNSNVNDSAVFVEEPVVTVAQSPSSLQYAPIANIPTASSVAFNKDRGVVISGNIHESVLPIGNASKTFNSNVSKGKVKKSENKKPLIDEYEVFRPAFSDERTISIRITVPGMDTNPVTTEIELPYDVFTGYFE